MASHAYEVLFDVLGASKYEVTKLHELMCIKKQYHLLGPKCETGKKWRHVSLCKLVQETWETKTSPAKTL